MSRERCPQAVSATTVRLVLIGLLGGAHTAHAAEPAIWYRAGEGCPDGASFLERVQRRGVASRVADAGDTVDFVVTLGPEGERFSGRLERQTSQGTIAIREVSDAECESVAEVLALTLALTQAGTPTVEAPSSQDGAAPTQGAATNAASRAGEVEPSTGPASDPVAEPAAGVTPLEPVPGGSHGLWLAGVSASASDVFDGTWLLLGNPFVEYETSPSSPLPRASFRVGAMGGLRADASAGTRLRLAALRLQSCPVAIHSTPISLGPCLVLDAGVLTASAEGRADTAFWSAVAAHLRFGLVLGRLELEGQAGVIAPLTQYEVAHRTSAATLEETSRAGFSGGVGAGYRFE